MRIRCGLTSALDLRRITAEDVAGCNFLEPEEKNVLHMLTQVSEADYKTHLSLDYGLPDGRARDRAHAAVLLDDFCGRMVAWGLAKFGKRTREWRILDKLRSLNNLLKAGFSEKGRKHMEDIITETVKFEVMTDPRDGIGLSGYRLKFEVEGELLLYDIIEVVAALKRFTEETYTELFVPAKIGSNDLANMPTLLGRLHSLSI